MPRFNVKFDGMGFTADEDLLDKEMTAEDLAKLNAKLQSEGVFPEGVHAVISVGISPDDGQPKGDYKVFVPVVVQVEADDIDAAEDFPEPSAVLLRASSALVDDDLDSTSDELGLQGTFQVLEVVEADEAVMQ